MLFEAGKSTLQFLGLSWNSCFWVGRSADIAEGRFSRDEREWRWLTLSPSTWSKVNTLAPACLTRSDSSRLQESPKYYVGGIWSYCALTASHDTFSATAGRCIPLTPEGGDIIDGTRMARLWTGKVVVGPYVRLLGMGVVIEISVPKRGLIFRQWVGLENISNPSLCHDSPRISHIGYVSCASPQQTIDGCCPAHRVVHWTVMQLRVCCYHGILECPLNIITQMFALCQICRHLWGMVHSAVSLESKSGKDRHEFVCQTL